MEKFQAFAHPWWVNLLVIVPVAAYFLWRRRGLDLTLQKKLIIAAFALAFGFAEAAVVVYLRAAAGLLPGYNGGTLAEVRRLSAANHQALSLTRFPTSLLNIEVLREAATMVMLVSIALLAASKARERWAAFLWAFAIWEIAYYAGLWATLGWPASLKEIDILFLIPVPWVAQVWYPLLVSALTLFAVAMAKKRGSTPADY
jgi:hypothetical protein